MNPLKLHTSVTSPWMPQQHYIAYLAVDVMLLIGYVLLHTRGFSGVAIKQRRQLSEEVVDLLLRVMFTSA